MLVKLKSSKTDSFRRGQSLVVARCSSLLCPVSATQRYFMLAQPRPRPLFYFQSGRLLTRSSVTHLLQDSARCAGLPYESLKGHSFRIGAASAAAAAGLPDWLIKVLGRWSSDCYQLYIRTPETVALSAVPKMARVSGNFIKFFVVAWGGCIACICVATSPKLVALLVSCHLLSYSFALILSDPACAALGR